MVYIGQSSDIYKRHREHMRPSQYNKQQINRVIQNNPNRYRLIIIKARSTFSKKDRDILEKHYIEFYNTFSDQNKFNYTLGGDFAPMYGKKHTEEAKRKMSEAKSGKNYGRVGENHPWYGKKHTEKTKRKISEANAGNHHSEEAKIKMSASRNTTGYFRVSGQNCPNCKSGKTYFYQYYNDDGKRIRISSVNLEKLKQKVIKAGLPWEKLN